MHKLSCSITTARTTSNIKEDFKHKYSNSCFERENTDYLNLVRLAKLLIYLGYFFLERVRFTE